MKMTKKLTSLAAASALCLSMTPALAFAADTNTGISAADAENQSIEWATAVDNVGKTEYWLQLEQDSMKKLSVDVPVRVVLAVNADGTFVTPTALKNVIENDSEFPVNVKAISITEKNGFTKQAANAFASSDASNIFKGAVKSVTLGTDGEGNTTVTSKQSVAFTGLDSYVANTAWAMQASDSVASATDRGTEEDPAEKTGDDCLFIQIEGAIANVEGHYFTAPINVFDLTYTFEASPATSIDATGTTSLATPVDIAD